MNSPQCDIVIPAYNMKELTKSCLDSVYANTKCPFNLIIIDNASSDDTKKFLEDFAKSRANVRLIRNRDNLGWVKAVNQGLRLSQAPYVVIMNNDTVVKTEGWLTKMITVADSEKEIGLVNPCFDAKGAAASPERPYIELDFCRGYCILIKRPVIDKIGYLDEAYGMGYYDDDDYSVRATRAGFKCVRANGVVVEHLRDSTFSRLFGDNKRAELHEKNKRLFYSKWGRRLNFAFIVTADSGSKALSAILFDLARRQHIIRVWSRNTLPYLNHINIRVKGLPPLFGCATLFMELMMNASKKEAKRYTAVFTDDDRLKKCLSKTGIPLYHIDIARDGRRVMEIADKAARVKDAL
jgi:GT2 family glycosyltransferase